MPQAELIRTVTGIKVALSMGEAIALVNTAERLGSIVDILNRGASPASIASFLTGAENDNFSHDQARDEVKTFFKISRAVGPLIEWGRTTS